MRPDKWDLLAIGLTLVFAVACVFYPLVVIGMLVAALLIIAWFNYGRHLAYKAIRWLKKRS